MSQNSKGLGRGLDALFNNQNQPPEAIQDTPFLYLAPEQLEPNPAQPREYFSEESLRDLAESIRSRGILQPLLVRPANEPGKWQIVAGERRWRAAKMAGLTTIPVITRNLSDQDTMISALVENIHRENLNPLEKAKGLEAIRVSMCLNQADLANYLGLQRSTVNNTLRLLNLSKAAQEDLISGKLTPGHAKCLLGLPEEAADELRQRIIEMGMAVRGAELAASFWQDQHRFPWQKPERNGKGEGRHKDPDIIKLASQIGTTLNCRAQINGTSQKGRINLTYDSNEQLFDLLEKLGLTLTS